MTGAQICPSCGGSMTVYEDPEQGAIGGRCPNCGRWHNWAWGKTPEAQEEPQETRPVEWETTTTLTLPPLTLIKIRHAEEQAEAIAEFIAYLESTCGVRMTLIDQTTDTAYIHTAGYLAVHDYNNKLGDLGIRYDVASGPEPDPLRRLAHD